MQALTGMTARYSRVRLRTARSCCILRRRLRRYSSNPGRPDRRGKPDRKLAGSTANKIRTVCVSAPRVRMLRSLLVPVRHLSIRCRISFRYVSPLLSRFTGKPQQPKRDHEVTFAEIEPWLTINQAWRRGFVKRFEVASMTPRFASHWRLI